MANSNPLDVLLHHDRWATLQILAACEGLNEEQFHKRFEMGPGSLHDTTTHLVGSLRNWTDFLERREMRPRPDHDGQRRSAAELRQLYEDASEDFARSARSHPLDEPMTRERGGKHYTFTRGAILTHVTTHAMHHRAQCLNMLRHVGANPLPKSSILEWTVATGG